MIKKIFIFILFFVFVSPVLAVDSSSSATSTKAAEIVQAVQKWADGSANSRKFYVGTIKSVGTSSYMVTTVDGDKTISTNDVTNFYRFKTGKRSDATFKTIKQGEDISAIGTIDPQTGEMTAKQILTKLQRVNVVGKIATLTEANLATILDSNGKATKVDLSDAGSYKKIDTANKIAASKLSDFKEGSVVFIMAYANDGTDALSALKAIVLNKP